MVWTWVYLGLNLLAFAVMRLDKSRARRGGRRLSETSLLMLAVPGWTGTKLAQRVFRHKTQKRPFVVWLNMAVLAHLALWVGLVRV